MAFLTCWRSDTCFVPVHIVLLYCNKRFFQKAFVCLHFHSLHLIQLWSSSLLKKLYWSLIQKHNGLLSMLQNSACSNISTQRRDLIAVNIERNDTMEDLFCFSQQLLPWQQRLRVAQYFWALLSSASLSISSSPYLCWSSLSLSICLSTSSRRA